MKKYIFILIITFISLYSYSLCSAQSFFGGKASVVLIEPEAVNWESKGSLISYMEEPFSYVKSIKTVNYDQNSSLLPETWPAGESSVADKAGAIGKSVNADYAISGLITKTDNRYQLRFFFYNVKKSRIDFKDDLSVKGILEVKKELREFCARAIIWYNRSRGEDIVLKSLVIPGLGQFIAGHKIRGLLIFTGAAGLAVKATTLTKGNPYNPKEILTTISGSGGDTYYWGQRQISYGEYSEEYAFRVKAEKSRSDAHADITSFTAIAAVYYLLNLADAVILEKHYSSAAVKKRYTLIASPEPSVSLIYRF